jgi:anti-anti-sigma factor
MNKSRILYSKKDGMYFLKLVGDIRHTVSHRLDRFIKIVFYDQDFLDLMVDMTETEYIDSTNLGLLAKISNLMRERFERKPTILSTNKNITVLLENIGFDKAFIIVTDTNWTPQKLSEISDAADNEKDAAMRILDAHRTLMELNEKNKDMFKSVVELLEKDVKKL